MKNHFHIYSALKVLYGSSAINCALQVKTTGLKILLRCDIPDEVLDPSRTICLRFPRIDLATDADFSARNVNRLRALPMLSLDAHNRLTPLIDKCERDTVTLVLTIHSAQFSRGNI